MRWMHVTPKPDGKTILIVEDEYFIAADLKRAFAEAGAVVLGPVGDLNEGLRLADGAIDAAVLDVNLEGAFSYALADRLIARGVPFVFVTGYDGWALPEAYRNVPRVAKPFSLATVVKTVAQLVEKPR